MAPTHRFLLGGYDAKTCPERLRKTLDPAYADTPRDPIPAGDQARMDAGVVFEAEIKKQWSKALGTKIALVDECDRSEKSKKRREKQTLALLADPGNAQVIWNARLPQQHATHRTGEPDALVLVGRDSNGKPQWVPVDVKDHASLEGTRQRTTNTSSLRTPHPDKARPADLGTGTPRKSDALQLAHYQRMLETLGYASDRNIGGIIGRELQIVWHQLDDALYRHDRLGTTSALEYYDHEFANRVTLATAALTGDAPANPEWKTECLSCQWRTTCHDELALDLDHITLLPGITPSRAKAHYDRGIRTTAALARLDWTTAALLHHGIDVPAVQWWSGTVDADTGIDQGPGNTDQQQKLATHGVTTAGDAARLCTRTAGYFGAKVWDLPRSIDQARVAKVGKVHLARGVERVSIDRATIEQDIDIEDSNGYVYLIGVRTTGRRRTGEDLKVRAEYAAFANWDGTDEGEGQIFADFWAHITSWVEKAAENRWGYRAYYFTHHEPSTFKRLARKHAGKAGVPSVDDVEAYFARREVTDLFPVLSTELVWPTESLTLKEMAKWTRFSWRDDDPGGGNSLAWYAEATSNPDPVIREDYRTRLLEYNADDVAAQVHIRDWLSRLGEARTPGARLPNVAELDKRFRRTRR